MQLTIDARLINSSGIGVYIQNILRSELLQQFKLKILFRKADQHLFAGLSLHAEMVEYNADLYSIKELVQTSAKTVGSEIFWSPHYNVPLINKASKLKVVTVHDVFHLAYFHTLSLSQKIYAKLMINKAVNSSDLVFTVSNTSKKEIIKYTGCGADKIKVVHNGINYVKFNTKVQDLNEKVLQEYTIDFPYVLFVGNVKPHKNLRNGLLGFKKLLLSQNGNYIKYKFVIVGRREGFITGDTKINELVSDPILKERIHFTGWVPDGHLPPLYQEASAFIFPSYYEGFGFPPLEAMAVGCPVISSDASCMPEIYGDAALFFNPDNPLQIADTLRKLLMDEDLRSQQVQKGYLQAKKYSWDDAISTKFDLIKEFAAK